MDSNLVPPKKTVGKNRRLNFLLCSREKWAHGDFFCVEDGGHMGIFFDKYEKNLCRIDGRIGIFLTNIDFSLCSGRNWSHRELF